MSCCCCATWLILPVVAFIVYKLFFSKKEKPEILESNWKKDTVYLYQFERTSTVPSVSPFCLKIETFLRVHKISYENRRLTMGRSQYGLLPFIELNGEHIADSQLIEEHLKKQFDIKPLKIAKDEAYSRTVARMVDSHTFAVLYKYKMYDDPSLMMNALFADLKLPEFLRPVIVPLASKLFKYKAGKRITISLGMFSDSEFMLLLRKDLQTLVDILGDQKFLFGDEMSTADFTVFGHLASMYYAPYKTIVNDILKEDYSPLIPYMERIKSLAFPDDFERK